VGKSINERYHSKYLDIYGKIILKGCPRSVIEGRDWIDLAQDRDR
jgi:hypothetical protein